MMKQWMLAIGLLLLLPLGAVWAGSGGVLVPNEPVEGAIEERGEQDVYTFQGEEGQFAVIKVTAEAGSSLDTVMQLYDPNGDLLVENDDAEGGDTTNSEIRLSLGATGEYRVTVVAFAGASVGNYEVLLTFDDSASATDSANVAGVLAYDEPVSGSLSGGESVTYNFVAEADQILHIAAEAELDSYLEIYAPDGTLLVGDDDSGAGVNPYIRNFRVPAAGDYQLIIAGYPNEPQSPYEVVIYEAEVVEAGEIAYGEAQEAELPQQGVVIFTFAGAIGDVIDARIEGSFDGYLELRDSAGNIIFADDDSGGDAQPWITGFELTANDTYTLAVTGFSAIETGDFTLILGLTDSIPVIPQGQSITYGETIESVVGTGGEVLLSFTGSANDEVTISVEAEFDSFLELRDADDVILATDDDSGEGLNPLIENFPLPADGDYQIRLAGFGELAGGRFTVSLSDGAAIVNNTASPAGTLTYGETVEGVLEAGQVTQFTFAAAEGDVVTARVEGSFDSVMEVLAADGTLIGIDDDSGGNGNPLLEKLALTEGDYTISIYGFDPSAAGNFSLTVEEDSQTTTAQTNNGDTPTVLTLGETANGNLPLGGNTSYVFNGEAGQIVSLSLAATDWFGDLDLFMEVQTPSGTTLAQSDDNGWLWNPAVAGLELPESGTYTVLISSYNGETGGDFALSLVEGTVYISPTGHVAEPFDLSSGEATLTVDIEANTIQLFEIQASVDQDLTLEAPLSDALAYVIYSPVNDLEELLDVGIPIRIPETGTYLISVFTDLGGSETATFTLTGESDPIVTQNDTENPSDTGDSTNTNTPPTTVSREAVLTERGDVVADTPERGRINTNETHQWVFKPQLAGSYTIVLNSQDPEGRYDPFVRVVDATGAVLAEDDDSGGNFNALIQGLELPSDETVTIEVGGFAGQIGGQYLLVVVGEEVETPPILSAGVLVVDIPVDNALLIRGQQAEFTLVIEEAGIFDLSLEGLKLPYVDLYDGEGNLLARGAAGLENLNLAEGRYQVLVYDRLNRSGGFRISVTASE